MGYSEKGPFLGLYYKNYRVTSLSILILDVDIELAAWIPLDSYFDIKMWCGTPTGDSVFISAE